MKWLYVYLTCLVELVVSVTQQRNLLVAMKLLPFVNRMSFVNKCCASIGLININQGILFEQVQTDLEKEGYSVQSVVIPAASKNAPHRRDRVWIIAHSNDKRLQGFRQHKQLEREQREDEFASCHKPKRQNEKAKGTR